jgi:hypothetical protein
MVGESDLPIFFWSVRHADLDGRGVSPLEEAGRRAAQRVRAIPVSAGKLITLPFGRPAHTLALGIERGREEITALASYLEEAIAAIGERESYPFRKPERRPFTSNSKFKIKLSSI